MKKLNNVIITGGAGFIGSNLVESLSNIVEGKIYVLDTFGKPIEDCQTHGSFKNLLGLNCIPLAIDIRNIRDFVKRNINEPISAIFHLAAISDTTSKNENVVLDINFNTFQQIIELSDFFYAPLIYASSGSVYGNKISHSNKLGTEKPNNIYGYSKLSMDNLNLSMGSRTNKGLPITGIRFFNVYGPRESCKKKSSSMILQIYNQLKDSKKCKLFYKSEEIFRDFVYITDVCDGMINALSMEPGIYNLGTGKCRNFKEIAEILCKELNLKGSDFIDYIENPYLDYYQFKTLAPWDETNILFKSNIKPILLEEGIVRYFDYLEN